MSQHLIPWNNQFNSFPIPTSRVGDTDKFIRESRVGVAERVGQEHNMVLTDDLTDNHGKHLEGSARCFISNIDVATPDVTIETVYTGDLAFDFKHGRQYFNPETRKLYVYVTNYTYVDAQSESKTINGFIEVLNMGLTLQTGSCFTAEATVVKEAISEGFVLLTGSRFTVVFLYASGVGAQLDVNNTGIKNIYDNSVITTATSWQAGDYVEFFYDGTQYHVVSVRKVNSLTKPKLKGDLVGNVTGDVIGNITGALTGNASTASAAAKWTTPRTLTVSGDASGSVSIDGSAALSLSLNVTSADTSQACTGNAATATYTTSTVDNTGVGRLLLGYHIMEINPNFNQEYILDATFSKIRIYNGDGTDLFITSGRYRFLGAVSDTSRVGLWVKTE